VGWAGVDAALWDIIGKAKGISVCRLLAIDHAPEFRLERSLRGRRFA
jgi:L-alanine-DL-glutamate epimerase-like enolase superfamily enzyme